MQRIPLATKPAAVNYNDTVVRRFAIMTFIWDIVGMAVGAWIAAELIWPNLNFNLPYLSYGRLRPLHANAVFIAFGGSALFASSYYIVQRTSQVRRIAPDTHSIRAAVVWRHEYGEERPRTVRKSIRENGVVINQCFLQAAFSWVIKTEDFAHG